TNGRRALRAGSRTVLHWLLFSSQRVDPSKPPRFQHDGLSSAYSAQECRLGSAVPAIGSIGLRFDLRFLLYLRADPGNIFPAREDTRWRIEETRASAKKRTLSGPQI